MVAYDYQTPTVQSWDPFPGILTPTRTSCDLSSSHHGGMSQYLTAVRAHVTTHMINSGFMTLRTTWEHQGFIISSFWRSSSPTLTHFTQILQVLPSLTVQHALLLRASSPLLSSGKVPIKHKTVCLCSFRMTRTMTCARRRSWEGHLSQQTGSGCSGGNRGREQMRKTYVGVNTHTANKALIVIIIILLWCHPSKTGWIKVQKHKKNSK